MGKDQDGRVVEYGVACGPVNFVGRYVENHYSNHLDILDNYSIECTLGYGVIKT
jgi:hypothetical protein